MQCNYNGDGSPATKFNLCRPVGLALDSTSANLYIGDMKNCRVRKLILKSDTISTFVKFWNLRLQRRRRRPPAPT